MKNDLDLNLSHGDFDFDASEHEQFAILLEKLPSSDENGFSAYSYKDWVFLINEDKSYCRFSMQLGAGSKRNAD